ncbi:hypothetical protein FB566_2326 [Stackebrandtia endophytica]|uniref:Uncharacterized protein n=1 Tax=Stackebrandtia endophytica TaxID=1496996 RepID=A0A543AW68_9ACTN|nr:hypothetical protein [Stackebrandtia endophytica]TQL76789.1 hypothetical protein FB566_2326 [Stackebrandtia endophytica]
MNTHDATTIERQRTQAKWTVRFGCLVAGICLVMAGIGLVGYFRIFYQTLDTFGRPDELELQAVALSGQWVLIAAGVLGALVSAWISVRMASVRGPDSGFPDYGTLILRAENDVRREVKRSARWASVVLVALALIGATVIRFIVEAPIRDDPRWWVVPVFLVAMLSLIWGIVQFGPLLGRWWLVGWSVDVFEEGLVESRFGAVRSAMPFRGGTLDKHGFVFTSPSPLHGPGRFTLAHHRDEQRSDVHNAVRMMAERVLVRDALTSLEEGGEVVLPDIDHVLTGRGIRLLDGREWEYSSLEVRLWHIYEGSRQRTETPEYAVEVEVLSGQEEVVTVGLRGPNAAVFREVLLVMSNAKYREDTSSLYAP